MIDIEGIKIGYNACFRVSEGSKKQIKGGLKT